MIHNFEESLRRERGKSVEADIFYRDKMHVTEIIRYNSDCAKDMDFQRKDIDAALIIGNKTYYVSEKFRETNFGDFYVEIFSKYPHVQGWIYTGSPNYVAYFVPGFVYFIYHQALKSFCLEKLLPQLPEKWFRTIYQSRKTVESKKIILDRKLLKLNLIQAHNKPTTGSAWETIGVSIPFSVLEENGIKIRRYSRPF